MCDKEDSKISTRRWRAVSNIRFLIPVTTKRGLKVRAGNARITSVGWPSHHEISTNHTMRRYRLPQTVTISFLVVEPMPRVQFKPRTSRLGDVREANEWDQESKQICDWLFVNTSKTETKSTNTEYCRGNIMLIPPRSSTFYILSLSGRIIVS